MLDERTIETLRSLLLGIDENHNLVHCSLQLIYNETRNLVYVSLQLSS
jgi:hypothetical protein